MTDPTLPPTSGEPGLEWMCEHYMSDRTADVALSLPGMSVRFRLSETDRVGLARALLGRLDPPTPGPWLHYLARDDYGTLEVTLCGLHRPLFSRVVRVAPSTGKVTCRECRAVMEASRG